MYKSFNYTIPMYITNSYIQKNFPVGKIIVSNKTSKMSDHIQKA